VAHYGLVFGRKLQKCRSVIIARRVPTSSEVTQSGFHAMKHPCIELYCIVIAVQGRLVTRGCATSSPGSPAPGEAITWRSRGNPLDILSSHTDIHIQPTDVQKDVFYEAKTILTIFKEAPSLDMQTMVHNPNAVRNTKLFEFPCKKQFPKPGDVKTRSMILEKEHRLVVSEKKSGGKF